MVTRKISELDSITTTSPSADVLAIVSSANTKKITVNNLINSAGDITISGNMTSSTGSFERVTISPVSSGTPSFTGVNGQILPGQDGADYFLYVYIDGAWRSGSLT